MEVEEHLVDVGGGAQKLFSLSRNSCLSRTAEAGWYCCHAAIVRKHVSQRCKAEHPKFIARYSYCRRCSQPTRRIPRDRQGSWRHNHSHANHASRSKSHQPVHHCSEPHAGRARDRPKATPHSGCFITATTSVICAAKGVPVFS